MIIQNFEIGTRAFWNATVRLSETNIGFLAEVVLDGGTTEYRRQTALEALTAAINDAVAIKGPLNIIFMTAGEFVTHMQVVQAFPSATVTET